LNEVEEQMKRMMLALSLILLAARALAADASGKDEGIVVQKLQGDVTVRHGVTEAWTQIAVGDVLKPDDSMKIGKRGSAQLLVRVNRSGIRTAKRMSMPAEVIVDMSDIRDLSQEELMLKLTMEKVRASSYQWRNEELHIPNASVVHGQNQAEGAAPRENDSQTGAFQLNGARVLFDNGFYSTCALKTMELFRLYPPLGSVFDNRLMMADALAQANLRSEALAEYNGLSRMEGLTLQQHETLNGRIAQMKR
jgi:hypothetical protein